MIHKYIHFLIVPPTNPLVLQVTIILPTFLLWATFSFLVKNYEIRFLKCRTKKNKRKKIMPQFFPFTCSLVLRSRAYTSSKNIFLSEQNIEQRYIKEKYHVCILLS